MLNGTRSATLQRRLKIVDLIRRHDAMRVEDLSLMFGVSAVTIRSDLAYLDDQGLVRRGFGKAQAPSDFPARQTGLSRQESEPLLADCASLILSAQQVFLGPGDLPLQLLPFLRQQTGLAVLLARIDAVMLARQCLEGAIHVVGGAILDDGVTLGGPQAEAHLTGQILDMAVLEVAGLSPAGVLFKSPETRDLALVACSRAGRRIGLLAATAPVDAGRDQVLDLDSFDDLLLPPSAQPALLDVAASHGFRAEEWSGGSVLVRRHPQREGLEPGR
ncbi:transcriptional regulator, DeoR family [Arboricoccus pini]|uniref:Transcriptional regulator, DeoR family n=1 Tax=Arboricoccus pini TaxID=1963835 RepID=A0A212RIA6_9PROT|nr:DeoR family transcriptional regulator [Arboricoccus pini]SNB72168.1 transcriptional regulator, DeoR family [Arboricoccus pini]